MNWSTAQETTTWSKHFKSLIVIKITWVNSGILRKEKEKNSKVAQHDTSQLHNNKKHLLAHAIL